ncbi:MAG TPA: hypothetical protein VFE23_02445 [Usitatibacter sp.]|jgi:hypothetical protein|nr:hypothetical protein [Usitatibacter sp.]
MSQQYKNNRDRLIENLANDNPEALTLSRNIAYGGAAACLVLLSQIIQVGAGVLSLKVSVIAACIGMPAFLAAGTMLEYLIILGPASHPFGRSVRFRACVYSALCFGGLSLMCCADAAAFYLSEIAGWVLLAFSVIALTLVQLCWAFVAQWWFGPNGPGEKELRR